MTGEYGPDSSMTAHGAVVFGFGLQDSRMVVMLLRVERSIAEWNDVTAFSSLETAGVCFERARRHESTSAESQRAKLLPGKRHVELSE